VLERIGHGADEPRINRDSIGVDDACNPAHFSFLDWNRPIPGLCMDARPRS
jgi:hypothetical protein